jgi:tRNA dimethylallyltransferase
VDVTARLVAIVGPTAAGKSAAALEVALALGGEVVNADAFQLYRGMDIGTAKLAPAERRGVTHHLLDIWPVRRAASVADYQGRARQVIDRLLGAGRGVVLVGGSGLYVQAVLDDLRFPATDPALRAMLEEELVAVGPAALHARLAGRDPAAAALIGPGNGRRVVRALEVVELTGAPFAASLPVARAHYPQAEIVGIGPPLDELDRRIERRVTAMFAAGLVAEVEALRADGLAQGITASRALGYRQVLTDPATAASSTAQATRRLARRQLSWFRRDPRVVWVDSADAAAAALGSGRRVAGRP